MKKDVLHAPCLKLMLLPLVLIGPGLPLSGQIGIGTTTPHPSAILELQSGIQGFLMPGMDMEHIEAISSPATGLLVYCTDSSAIYIYNGSGWSRLVSGSKDDADADPENEIQSVSISNDTVYLSEGGFAKLPSFTILSDSDGDTRIFTEKNPDEDMIRFDIRGSEVMLLDTLGRLGIGTATVLSKLHIKDGALLIDGETGGTPVSGQGTRLMWIPAKAAFRAGHVTGTQWDNDSIGQYSTAFGLNAKARGESSFVGGGFQNQALLEDAFVGGGALNQALGVRSFVGGGFQNQALLENAFVGGGALNQALGMRSFVGGGWQNQALGHSSFASGEFSIASGSVSFIGGGIGNQASGQSSFASGEDNIASGYVSFISGGVQNQASGSYSFVGGGTGLLSPSFAQASFGRYNVNLGSDATGWTESDPLFVIGNGTGPAVPFRRNAVTVLKNGNVGIGNAAPLGKLHITDGALLVQGTTGGTPVSGQGRRLMWIPAKAAFRAGHVEGTHWDNDSIGQYSTAFGYNAKARGSESFVGGGFQNQASGLASFASGEFSIASGNASFIGGGSVNKASGVASFASGEFSIASGNASFIGGGNGNHASGNNSFVGGGIGLFSPSFAQASFGGYNVNLGSDPTGWTASDPLFVIGNGTGPAPANRRNAVTVLKNGNVGIGTIAPVATLDVWGSARFNAGQANSDLRMSSIGQLNMFYLDASENCIGMGLSNPQLRLHIANGSSNLAVASFTQNGIGISSSTDFKPRIYLEDNQTTTTTTNNRVIMTEFRNGRLTWNRMNDNATEFVNLNLFVIETGGHIGIGVADPSQPLHMLSGAHCTAGGAWTNASDVRLKKSITPVAYGLNEVLKLRPVSYMMKSDTAAQIGFIAQEVRAIIPELISGTEGDISKGETLGMSYGNLTAVLVKAMQEQQEMIESMKEEIRQLRTMVGASD